MSVQDLGASSPCIWFSDDLLTAQGKIDETDDRINDRRRIFSPQPECLRRFGEKNEYSGINRSKIPAKSPSQIGIPPQNQNQQCAGAVEIDGKFWSRLQS